MAQATVTATRMGGTSPASLVQVSDLTGGIDLRRAPSLMAPNRARVLRNYSLSEPGALTVYPGYRTWAPDYLWTVVGGRRIYLSSEPPFTLVATSEGAFHVVTDAGTWGLPVCEDWVVDDTWFCYDRSLVAAWASTLAPKKTTGSAGIWSPLGVPAPAAAPSLALQAGGTLVDGHTYAVAYGYLDAGLSFEGNTGPSATVTCTTGTQTIEVTVEGSTDLQVDTVTIYAQDVTAGESVLRRVGTVAAPVVPATTTYTITSNTWSSGLEALTDYDQALPAPFAVVWKNRWWARDAAVSNRIRFTQVFLPQAWPALFYLDIPFTTGDRITAMVPLGDTLVVFGTSDVFLIIGQTSLDFEVRPSAGAMSGAFGPHAAVRLETGVVHASTGGVFLFDGATDRLLSWDIDPGWRDLVQGATTDELEQVALSYHEPRKELHCAVPRLYPLAQPGEWILDLSRTRTAGEAAWTTTTRTIQGYLAWDGPELTLAAQGRLFSWPPTSGPIYEELSGTTADGADLVAEYEGPALATGLPVARWIELYGEYKPTDGAFSVEVLVDDLSVMTQPLATGAAGAVYGSGIYGTATYAGGSRDYFVQALPLEAEGRTVTLRTVWRGQQPFTHYTYAYTVVPEGLPRGMR